MTSLTPRIDRLEGYTSGLNAPQAIAHVLTDESPHAIYISSPVSAVYQDLPSTGVIAGQSFRLIVVGGSLANYVALRSSAGNEIDRIGGSGFILVQALQDVPTSNAHWKVLDVDEKCTHSTTFSWDGGGSTSSSINIRLNRRLAMVSLAIETPCTATTGTNSALLQSTTDLEARFRPSAIVSGFARILDNALFSAVAGAIDIDTSGNIRISKSNQATFTNSQAAGLGNAGLAITYPL